MGSTTHIAPATIARHVAALQAAGDRLEAAGNPDWLPIARAAALLESLRLGLSDLAEVIEQPAHGLADQRLDDLLADPLENLTHHVAPCDELKGANLWPATTDARHYDQRCGEVRHA